MLKNEKDVRPDVSETVKFEEQSTDSTIVVPNNLSNIRLASAIKVVEGSLLDRTLSCRPKNEDALRGII